MAGGVCARQVGMHGKRCCMAGGACMAVACMVGGMHGTECAQQWACIDVGGGHRWQERRPLQRTVRILLECILIFLCCLSSKITEVFSSFLDFYNLIRSAGCKFWG